MRLNCHRFVFVYRSVLSDIILSKPVHLAQSFDVLLHLVADYRGNILPLPLLIIILFALLQVLLVQELPLLDIALYLLTRLYLFVLEEKLFVPFLRSLVLPLLLLILYVGIE